MGNHLVQGSIAILGLFNAHNLHLVKLVQAVKAPHVLAVTAGFAAEAGGVGGELLGELIGPKDHVAVDIGHGHLCGGNHVEVVHGGVVHLAFLVRQLAGTKTGGGVHHHGRLNLFVTGSGVAVQEIVDKGALEFGSLAFVHRETGAGDLYTQVEVYDIVLFGQFPVREGTFGELGLFAAHFHH